MGGVEFDAEAAALVSNGGEGGGAAAEEGVKNEVTRIRRGEEVNFED